VKPRKLRELARLAGCVGSKDCKKFFLFFKLVACSYCKVKRRRQKKTRKGE
jgi:hypothetical protein